MEMQIFTIYDSKAEVYFKPFYLINVPTALRQFSDMCNDPESQIQKHPADYTLFHLGLWTDSDSSFDLSKKSLGVGVEFVINSLPDDSTT